MMDQIETRLAELGLVLPQVTAPVANYVPFVISQNLIFVSGQLPMQDGALLYSGKVGSDVTVEEGQTAARQCALNVIAQLKAACEGDLGQIKSIVKVTGFVACAADFVDHPAIVNGASDVMVDIFGDIGRHARAAVGCPSLPLDSPVEVEAIAEIS